MWLGAASSLPSARKNRDARMGGNAPFIVFDGADIEMAVAANVRCQLGGNDNRCWDRED
jgi:acyl-CoA reductase-like NAD-dependent aldehyde dehydrogenase